MCFILHCILYYFVIILYFILFCIYVYCIWNISFRSNKVHLWNKYINSLFFFNFQISRLNKIRKDLMPANYSRSWKGSEGFWSVNFSTCNEKNIFVVSHYTYITCNECFISTPLCCKITFYNLTTVALEWNVCTWVARAMKMIGIQFPTSHILLTEFCSLRISKFWIN